MLILIARASEGEKKMVNIDNRGIGRLFFGIFVLVFALILLLYEQVDTYTLNGVSFSLSRGYTYQFIGIPLIFVGILFVFIGGYRWKRRPRKEMLKSNIEVIEKEVKESSETIQPEYSCRNCGFKNPKDSVFCNKCGKPLS
jgi:ribosomal protein L40E